MTRTRTDRRSGRDTPTLGALTVGQLLRLCQVAGLDRTDAEAYAGVLVEALGAAAGRPLDLPPPSRTFLSDDHTPVEFSLSFLPGGAPSLRVLLEPGCAAGSLKRNGRAGLRVIRELAQRWRFATDPLDEVEDLFFPANPQGSFALWCALELGPGGIPRLKVYLNPNASGEERAAEIVRKALRRLGHRKVLATLPPADGYPFLALDLGAWEAPRVKVYVRHDGLAAEEAPSLSRMDPGPGRAEVEEFVRTAAGFGGDAFGQGLGHEARLTGRPALTCHAFTEAGTGPTGFTLHIPVREYARHDGEALARATTLLGRYGMDTAALWRALPAVTSRRPEDGVGLIAYLALAHQHGRPPRVTAYLSSEAYRVRPPVAFPPTLATAGR
ncbi:tryptophan dimethylallyltransferase family protein [Streptomyces sp. NPDC006259]|uniref:tryptophan dimethylallyltransferase family protein n=1 Tax=Streptomyces sp. NPDC006259 TaxID=3364740 RepID=UPI00368FFD5C